MINNRKNRVIVPYFYRAGLKYYLAINVLDFKVRHMFREDSKYDCRLASLRVNLKMM